MSRTCSASACWAPATSLERTKAAITAWFSWQWSTRSFSAGNRERSMTVQTLTPAQIGEFRKLAQPPVTEFVVKEVGNDWVDRLFAAIKETR